MDVEHQIIFTIFEIPIRDTVVSTWIMMIFIVLVILLLRKWEPFSIEMVFDFFDKTISDVMGRSGTRYIPFLGTLGIFILASNLIGVVPFINSPTSDLNTTIALSLVVFLSVYVYGLAENGVWKFVKNMASPIILLPFELIGQVSRTVSLSLRLFGNIFSGELIVGIIFSLVPLIMPITMQLFGMFTGVLQAYIFMVLATTYLASAVSTVENDSKNKTIDHVKEIKDLK